MTYVQIPRIPTSPKFNDTEKMLQHSCLENIYYKVAMKWLAYISVCLVNPVLSRGVLKINPVLEF